VGRADPDLDELGIDQARRLGAALGHEAGPAVDRIVTSPLARTRQTAAAVAAATGAAVTVDERFVELDYGEWDQRPLADVAADEWAAWRADVAFAPPGGESLAELGRRVRSGLDDLAEEARDRTIVVVTHVSPIKAAVAWAVGGTDEMAWRMFVAPASITRIATSVGAPSLHTFNDCSHLTG
jgi:broad specificity phosphatase PhoE